MNTLKGLSFQAENPKNLSKVDLNKIYEIEQDMWAEGIGEYVKCKQCHTILSKKDIFGHLSKEIYLETVSKIKQILSLDLVKCTKCNGNTDFIWGIDYLKEIKERYNDENSFLTIARNQDLKIIGFTDGYISDFETIYKREFEYYYSNIGAETIKKEINNIIGGDMPDKLLIHSTTGVEKKYSNLNNFITLLKNFYIELANKGHNNILCVKLNQVV